MYGARTYGSNAYAGLTETTEVLIVSPATLSVTTTLQNPETSITEVVGLNAITTTLHAPTVTAQNKEIVILINAVDVSNQVRFDSIDVSNNLYSDPDTASFEILKATHKSYTPAYGDEIIIEDSGVKIFAGILVKLNKRVEDFVEFYNLEFKDYTEELGNILIAETYTTQTVETIITDIFTSVVGYDSSTNVNDTTNITNISFDNISIVECLDRLAELSGKVWYLSPDKEIFFDAKTAIVAPYELSDTNGKYFYPSLITSENIGQIRNKVTIKGSGIAAVTVEDLTSQGIYGVREYFEKDDDTKSVSGATQKAQAILDSYKDPIITATFETSLEGLFTAQQIRVQSTLRGFDHTLNIENVTFQSRFNNRFYYKVKATSERLGGIEDLFVSQLNDKGTIIPLSDQNSLQDVSFTSIDFETISWSSGTITMSDGTTYSIVANASQTLTSDHIIYFDKDVSTTVLQISTNFADGIGPGKLPLAYATRNAVSTKGADIFPVSFGGQMQLDGGVHITDRSILAANIAANSITANEVAANTITANEMNVTQLSAITADVGTLTAGTIEGVTITAVGGSSGINIELDPTTRKMKFLYNGNEEAFIYGDSNGDLWLDADNAVFISATGTGDDIFLDAGDVIFETAKDYFGDFTSDFTVLCDEPLFFFNEDNDGSDCWWVDGSDAEMSLKDNGDLYIDGSYFDTGADFAEYFESVNGEEIPVGTSVILVGDKVQEAKTGEQPIGIISAAPTIVGNSDPDAGTNWSGKYMTDEFGRRIMEEAEHWSTKDVKKSKVRSKEERKEKKSGWVDRTPAPQGATVTKKMREKVNPDWNNDQQYTPRKDRPEWNVVGLIGRLRITKGQITNSNWIKLKDINENVEEWLIK